MVYYSFLRTKNTFKIDTSNCSWILFRTIRMNLVDQVAAPAVVEVVLASDHQVLLGLEVEQEQLAALVVAEEVIDLGVVALHLVTLVALDKVCLI